MSSNSNIDTSDMNPTSIDHSACGRASNKPILEICTGDPEGVKAAVTGGADRVELCGGLSEGGLSPSAAMIRYSSLRIPTNVLIRPRAGDFVYTEAEADVMVSDIEVALEAGAQAIVTGALTPDGKIDRKLCRRLMRPVIKAGAEATFHRAFDLVEDPFEALQEIIELGFTAILTSGQAAEALEGAALIRKLCDQASGRIEIIAGAGVTPLSAPKILEIARPDAIHGSARSLRDSAMQGGGSAVAMGSGDNADGSRMATDPAIVRRLREIIDQYSIS